MLRSRIASRGRTTLPVPVRETLGLAVGDVVVWRIEEGCAVLTPAGMPADDPFAAFREWDSTTDRDGYAGL